VLILAC